MKTSKPVPLQTDVLPELMPLSKILGRIRPVWKNRGLVTKVKCLLEVDLGCACQKLFNATMKDMREKTLMVGMESIHRAIILNGLPRITDQQSLKYYPISHLIELSHVLGLLSREEQKTLLRCSEIVCDIAQEDGDRGIDKEDALFLFGSCVTYVLGKEPLQIPTTFEKKKSDSAGDRYAAPREPRNPTGDGGPVEKLRLLEAILDSIPEMISYHDCDLNVLWANKAQGDSAGLSREDIIGRYFYEIACRSEKPCDDCPVWKGHTVCDTQKTEKIENRLHNGRLYYTRSFPVLDNGIHLPGRLVVVQDITNFEYRYGVNEALNLISEAFSSSRGLQLICEKLLEIITSQFNYPTGAITLYDEKSNEIVVIGTVDGSGRLAPFGKRQPLSRTFTGCVLEDSKVINISSLGKTPEFGGYVLKKAGAETVIAIPLNAEGKTIGALILADFVERLDAGLIVDALQAVANRLGVEILRKQAEETLRRERNFTTAVLNNAGSLILVVDKEGRIVRFNKTCERLTGYSHAELRGRYLWECLIPPEEKDIFLNLFPFNREKMRKLPSNFENNWVTKEGQRRLISWSNTIMGDGKTTEIHIVSIGIDITDKRKMEKEAELRQRQLIQADKMASLGVLVSGVAHEINNPNNFIMMNTPILRKACEDIAPILEKYAAENGDFTMAGLPYSEMCSHIPALFDGIQDGSERIGQIVMNLKDYSREDVSNISQDVNLNKAVEAALRLLSNQIKISTEFISVTYSEILPPVKGSLQRLEQVIINLVQNACQALPDHDKGIDIRTFYDRKRGEVVVRIKDEGIGIEEAHIGKILDPFFTTKRDNGGTGLGLSVCAGIVKEHNGRLDFSSKPGEGTTVCLVLPAVAE